MTAGTTPGLLRNALAMFDGAWQVLRGNDAVALYRKGRELVVEAIERLEVPIRRGPKSADPEADAAIYSNMDVWPTVEDIDIIGRYMERHCTCPAAHKLLPRMRGLLDLMKTQVRDRNQGYEANLEQAKREKAGRPA